MRGVSFLRESNCLVSIRAPLRRAGRYGLGPARAMARKFQSAPRSEERGDVQIRTGALLLIVSIRAPLRRTGRYGLTPGRRRALGFNPRPAPKSGAMVFPRALLVGLARFNPRPAPKSGAIHRPSRDKPRGWSFNPRPAPMSGAMVRRPQFAAADTRFNPRPAPKSGAIKGHSAYVLQFAVSIRAPLRRAGR